MGILAGPSRYFQFDSSSGLAPLLVALFKSRLLQKLPQSSEVSSPVPNSSSLDSQGWSYQYTVYSQIKKAAEERQCLLWARRLGGKLIPFYHICIYSYICHSGIRSYLPFKKITPKGDFSYILISASTPAGSERF